MKNRDIRPSQITIPKSFANFDGRKNIFYREFGKAISDLAVVGKPGEVFNLTIASVGSFFS
jgi:hypothetical protein